MKEKPRTGDSVNRHSMQFYDYIDHLFTPLKTPHVFNNTQKNNNINLKQQQIPERRCY